VSLARHRIPRLEERDWPEPGVGTREECEEARREPLAEEKALTRRSDELACKRREPPWVPVEKDYGFETEDGTGTLADLFDGGSQLLFHHCVFDPPHEGGCLVCSSIADILDPYAVHLKAHVVRDRRNEPAGGDGARGGRADGSEGIALCP
jgi:predicted dithiol-disulfide oxidoreductase (DUF899 family)